MYRISPLATSLHLQPEPAILTLETGMSLPLNLPIANFPVNRHLVGRTVRILPNRTGELLFGTYLPPVTLTLSPTRKLVVLPPHPVAALFSTFTGLAAGLRVLRRFGAILTPASWSITDWCLSTYLGEGPGIFQSSFFFKGYYIAW